MDIADSREPSFVRFTSFDKQGLFVKAAVLSVSNNNTSMSLRGADANLAVREGLYGRSADLFSIVQ